MKTAILNRNILEDLLGQLQSDTNKNCEITNKDSQSSGETLRSYTRFFQIGLREARRVLKESLEPGHLSQEGKESIMANCLYTMAKAQMVVYCNYLLLFPAHQVIIGKFYESIIIFSMPTK